MYKSVYELTDEQLEELKWNYFYSDEYENCEYPHFLTGELVPVLFAGDIPNEVIYEKYAGITFVNDDFSCTAGL